MFPIFNFGIDALKRSGIFKLYHNMEMMGLSLGDSKVISMIECLSVCIRYALCYSVNFNELNGVLHFGHTVSVQTSSGSSTSKRHHTLLIHTDIDDLDDIMDTNSDS